MLKATQMTIVMKVRERIRFSGLAALGLHGSPDDVLQRELCCAG
jgi:hypothetical protein